MMKRAMILLLLLWTIGLWSFTCWDESGALVAKSNNLSWDNGGLELSDGNFLVVWSDSESEWQQMKAMKVNEMGEQMWAAPVLLCNSVSLYPRSIEFLETDSGVVISWIEQEEITSLRTLKIDLSGNRLWGEDGLSFDMGTGYSSGPKLWLIEGEAGGVFLVLHEFDWPQEVKAIYLNSDGELGQGWSAEGNIILSSMSELPFFVISDGYGGILVGYLDYGYGVFQRCTNEGELLWGEAGIEHLLDAWNLQIYLHEPGEYRFIYENDNQFYLNWLDASGDFLWADPIEIFTLPEEASYRYDMELSSDDGYLIAWREGDQLKAQKVILGEEPLWGEDGLVIGTDLTSYSSLNIIPDDSGGTYIAWDNYGTNPDIFLFQHIDSDGEPYFGEIGYGVEVCEERGYDMQVFVESNDSAKFMWYCGQDTLSAIKMQVVSSSGELLLEPEGRDIYSLFRLFEGDRKMVCWEDYSAFITEYCFTGKTEIRCQILEDETGNRLFPEQAQIILSQQDMRYEVLDCAFDEEEELLYVTFSIYSNTDAQHNLGVQAIDIDGNLLYGDTGLLISDWEDGTSYEHVLLRPELGGMRIVWNETCPEVTEQSIWRMQQLDNAGLVWQEAVNLCGATTISYKEIVLTGDYLVWIYGDYVRVLKFDQMGNIDPAWNGDYLETAELGDFFQLFVHETEEGVILLIDNTIWGDNDELYGYLISDQGEFLWGAEGRLLMELDGYCRFVLTDNYFYRETGGDWSYQRIIDKYNYEGEILWDESVMWIEYGQVHDTQILVRDDKFYIYYCQETGEISRRVLTIKGYNGDGSIITGIPTEGLAICDESGSQWMGAVKASEEGKDVVFWYDYRNSAAGTGVSAPSVYAQKIDLTVLENGNNNIVNPPVIIRNYPNPFSLGTWFEIQDETTRETGTIEIYNIKGQKLKTLDLERDGEYWDGTDSQGKKVSVGIYLYRLKGGSSGNGNGKMLILK